MKTKVLLNVEPWEFEVESVDLLLPKYPWVRLKATPRLKLENGRVEPTDLWNATEEETGAYLVHGVPFEQLLEQAEITILAYGLFTEDSWRELIKVTKQVQAKKQGK